MLSRLFRVFVLIGIAVGFCRGAESSYPLRKLLIADTEAKVVNLDPLAGGNISVWVQDVGVLSQSDFASVISPFLGRPITNDLLNELARTITSYAQKHDRLVRFIIPTQDISTGIVRMAVLVGRYNDLTVKGNRWFSSQQLEEKLGVHPGDEIRFSALEAAVNWANTNPFRHIQVLVQDLPASPGKADLLIGVADRLPVRFAASYDNGGVQVLGPNRYIASVQLGNLWARDHQASYQFITGDRIHDFQAHTINYRAPLPWRHYVDITGTYMETRPDLSGIGLTQKGQNIVGDIKYSVPVGAGAQSAEYFCALDFKESNNNLQIGGFNVSNAKVDTFQFEFGATIVRRDAKGAWVFGTTVNLSPGNINARNTDEQFQPSRTVENFHIGRPGAKARYVATTLSIQRLQKFGHGWDVFSRMTAQLSSTNLVSNEQLAIGGMNTVRGFKENILAGDQGVIFNNDLESPTLDRKISFHGRGATLETRLIGFYDFGEVTVKHPSGLDQPSRPIASVGAGIRMTIANNFSLNLDYGWEVTHPKAPIDNHDRGHIKVVLAY